MVEIGSKVFWRKASGEVIFVTPESAGDVVVTTAEDDAAFYPQLRDYDFDKLGVIQLGYQQHKQDFEQAISYWVNPATQKLEFKYKDSATTEPIFQKPLTERVAELKLADLDNKEAIAGLIQLVMEQSNVT
ncbi:MULTISPECIES: hypothetical protein [unclassified Paenibacillus]|uniref:hypothetical protein n=1 Tax=unclassified Paenibacillus TaxID=185978 RepID=UPI0004902ED5|nr:MULTISPECIES: hypothetical protein [unclassified Paenibacillus]SFR01506.1 hypothetical protein SAMN04488603_1011002 [Paenibacillus sp. cl130]